MRFTKCVTIQNDTLETPLKVSWLNLNGLADSDISKAILGSMINTARGGLQENKFIIVVTMYKSDYA